MPNIKEKNIEEKPLTFLDYQRAISIVKNNIEDYEKIDKRLFADKNFVLFFYKEADIQNNFHIKSKTPILQYDEAKELRKDEEVIKEALKVHPKTIEYISFVNINLDELTRDIILPALKKNFGLLTSSYDYNSKLIRERFKDDKKLVMELFNYAEENNIDIDYSDRVILKFEEFEKLRKDEEVVKKSLKLQPCSIAYIDKKFAEDEELILPALKRYPILLSSTNDIEFRKTVDPEFRQIVVDNKELLLKIIRDSKERFKNQYLEPTDKYFYDVEVLIATLAQYDDSFNLSNEMSNIYDLPYKYSGYKITENSFVIIKKLIKRIKEILDENKKLGNPRKLSEEEILNLYKDIKSNEDIKHAIPFDNLLISNRIDNKKTDKDYLQDFTDAIASSSKGIISQPDLDIDSSLSRLFYEFLSAKSNNLPTKEYIKEIEEKSKDIYISVGYGVSITSNDGIKLTCTTPMEDGTERIDIITSDDYNAIKMYKKSYKTINPEDENNRIFSPKRVEIIQERLKNYEMINGSKGKARIKK